MEIRIQVHCGNRFHSESLGIQPIRCSLLGLVTQRFTLGVILCCGVDVTALSPIGGVLCLSPKYPHMLWESWLLRWMGCCSMVLGLLRGILTSLYPDSLGSRCKTIAQYSCWVSGRSEQLARACGQWMEGMDWLGGSVTCVATPLACWATSPLCAPSSKSSSKWVVSAVSHMLLHLRHINNASSDLVYRFPKWLPQYKDDDPPKKMQNGVWLSLQGAQPPIGPLLAAQLCKYTVCPQIFRSFRADNLFSFNNMCIPFTSHSSHSWSHVFIAVLPLSSQKPWYMDWNSVCMLHASCLPSSSYYFVIV